MFPGYSRNIPQIYVSKIFQRYPRNIIRLWKCFCEVILGCPMKFLILAVSSLECFFEFYWDHFSFRVMFWKGSYRCLTAGKKVKIRRTSLSVHNMIIIIINLFSQVINISVRSAYGSTEWKNLCNCICFWDHAIWPHVTIFFNCSYRYTSLPTRITEPSNHWAFSYSKSSIETLEQGVKSVQS